MTDRTGRVDAALRDRGVDALLVASPANLRWLTGYSGSHGAALAGPGVRRFATDFRYMAQAREEVGEEWGDAEIASDLLGRLAEGGLPARLGFEDDHLTVRERARLAELAGEGVELVPAGGLVEALRIVKDARELELIRTAARVADEAFREVVVEGGLAGRTERDVALDLETAMRRRGADRVAFPVIVAAGPHGALPHATPRDVPIPEGTLVVVDWGAVVEGYASDCTRTVATGAIDPRDRAVYNLVLRAQLQALAAVRPGPLGREVDAVARAVIDAAGHGEQFGHGLGHGVGLDVHEEPTLSKRGGTPLGAGNVVTVEPGVYVPGRVGVRIEDLVVVTEEGCEVVSSLPKELETVA
ncbi:MAG TPA: Xaa-Pro peptidase family protein [Solirubrobacteraceae bacterium]|nr:Xaa-Pro peptidase family protein [Solirubrobacteraceae bacterium]